MPEPTPPADLSVLGFVDQSPLLATVIGGVIVFIIAAILTRIPKLKPYFHKGWARITQFLKWVFELRISTGAKRDAMEIAGYERRNQEVVRERSRSMRPHWRVSNPHDDIFYLHNSGYAVSDVMVWANPEFFVFDGGASHAFLGGVLGDNNHGSSRGTQFLGKRTERGKRQGVDFTFEWIDQNGDAQPSTSGAANLSTYKLHAVPLKPVVQPSWQIAAISSSQLGTHILADHTWEESLVANVSIGSNAEYFVFMGKHEWPGETFGKGKTFVGRATEFGHNLGVTFVVDYDDVNGERKRSTARLAPGKGAYGYGMM